MRVLHLIDSEGVYGAEIMLLGLVETQRVEGIDVEVGSIAATGELERPLEKECRRRGIPCRRIRFSPAINVFAAGRILSKITEDGVDLLHTHGYKADILFGMLLRVIRRIPALTTVHGWTETRRISKMALYQALQITSWHWIERVVSVADDSPVYRIHGLASRAVTIENGIAQFDEGGALKANSASVARIERHCKSRPCIGMVSRLSREKGIDTMLSAMARLRAGCEDYALVIVGEGPERNKIEQCIARDRLGDNVLLMGYVEGASRLIPYFDLLAMPSRTEGLPMTLLEAMVSEVPVIASRVGQIPKVLGEGACGVMIEPEDDRALAYGIRRLMGDKRYRDALAERARRRVMEKYSISQTTSRYATLYKELIASVTE